MLKKLWKDDCGAIISTEYMLVATLVLMGVVGGLTNLRDSVTKELTKTGEMIEDIRNLNKPIEQKKPQPAPNPYLDRLDLVP